MILTSRTRPVSLRPSGLAESPLLRIGLALLLVAAKELLDDLRRFGMMRTMTAGRGPSGVGRLGTYGAIYGDIGSRVAVPSEVGCDAVTGWTGCRRELSISQARQDKAIGNERRGPIILWSVCTA